MEKHSHYQEQLELSHQKLRHVEALGDKEHIKKNQEKYNTIAEKTREIGYKVRREVASASNTTKLLSSGPPAEVKNPSLDCSCHLISGAAATVFCHKQTAVGNCLTAPKEMLLIGFIQGKFIVIVYLVYKYSILTPLYHCVHQKRITCFQSSLLNRRKIMSSMYVN